MLKWMPIVAALAASSGDVHAQTSPLQVGVTSGLAITTFSGDDTDNAKSRTSPFFGGSLVVHPASSMIGFQTGLLYVPKGASTAEGGDEATLKLTYLEIPALLRLALNLAGSEIRPVVAAGGSVAINTACEAELSSGSASIEVDCDDSAFEGELDVKKVDFGLSAGVAVDIPIGARAVLAPSARYTRGLTNIGDTPDNADAKNSAIQLGVTVRIAM